MRRRILTILLAVLVVALVVPIGAALTLERRLPLAGRSLAHAYAPAARAAAAPAAALPESASLALTGGVLIGLAAAFRRVS